MARKETSKQEPVVSSLPLPQSETPLVIDLPDGQKLVVGKMQTGTVIEVATWRGTGRPDSRTNRMMLGVSVAGQPSSGPSESSQSAPSSVQDSATDSKGLKAQALTLIEKLFSQFKNIKSPKVGLKAGKTENNPNKILEDSQPKSAPESTSATSKSSAEFDVDEWLNKIQEKNAIKAAKIAKPSVKKSGPKQASARKTTNKPAAKKSKR